MKAKDLIEDLRGLPEDTEVYLRHPLDGYPVDVQGVYQYSPLEDREDKIFYIVDGYYDRKPYSREDTSYVLSNLGDYLKHYDISDREVEV